MRKKTTLNYLYLFLAVIGIISIPAGPTRYIKNKMVGSCAPVWSFLRQWQVAGVGWQSSRGVAPSKGQEKIAELEKENRLLREQCGALHHILTSEEYIARQGAWLQQLQGRETVDPQWKEFFKRRAAHLSYRLQYHMQSLPAKVIFREPRHWGSMMWINVGEEDNQKTGAVVVAHNSPVVIGNVLIGVVENVEARRSEVRLITDTRLVPSVRAVRGEQSHASLLLLMEHLITLLQKRSGLVASVNEEKKALQSLFDLRASLKQGWGDYYLAKGEVCGSSEPLWRAKQSILRGFGFNYDTADEEGSARDLRSGDPIQGAGKGLPLIQPGDLLITSGLDGIFPQGLEVGFVSKVNLLREGDCTYDLEALPVVENFSEFEYVTVLPPVTTSS